MEHELSIVVPSYNEGATLLKLIDRYRIAKGNIHFQLVIVNNGSTDNTEEIIDRVKAKKEYDFITFVRIFKNKGYGYGIYNGLLNCESPVIGWSHADLQCAPEDIFRAYTLYKMHYNNGKGLFIKGSRFNRPFLQLVFSSGLALCSRILLKKCFSDINGQPKIFPKVLLKSFHKPPVGFSFDLYAQYIAKKNMYKILDFPVRFNKREAGVSKSGATFLSKCKVIKTYFIDIFAMARGSIS